MKPWTQTRRQALLGLPAALALVPRDADFVRVFTTPCLMAAIPHMSVMRRLLLAAACSRDVATAVQNSFSGDPDAQQLCRAFFGPFPPRRQHLKGMGSSHVGPLQELALGQPGDPVGFGLFPSRVTKNARVLLSAAGFFRGEEVHHAAVHAYDRARPYHAHDAVACALVHPNVDPQFITPLLRGKGRGWRSRRKTWALHRWSCR